MPRSASARAAEPPDVIVGLAGLVLALALISGCSLKTMAVKSMANTLSGSGDVFARDDDPELIRDAVPFALKTYESLLETVPEHEPLLLATCRGFTQYAFAFVQLDSEKRQHDDYPESKRLRDRALRLYLRGRGYCLRALDVRFGSIGAAPGLAVDPVLAQAEREDVPLLYWTAASWGSAIALAPDEPDLMIDFPVVRSLLQGAMDLDEPWEDGALHEVLITIESLELLGGSEDRARQHFHRAVALQKGLSPGPYVALATSVSVANQNREEFERLLHEALAIDPNDDPGHRLATIITQDRARWLLDHIDSLFSK
ncbi:MAG: TRAP transporter TatT component family protein [Gemmatimonadota bacterium]